MGLVDRCGSVCSCMKGNFVQLLDLLIAWLPPLYGIFSRDIHPRRAEAREQILVDLEVRGKMRQTPPISGKGAIYAVHSITRALGRFSMVAMWLSFALEHGKERSLR